MSRIAGWRDPLYLLFPFSVDFLADEFYSKDASNQVELSALFMHNLLITDNKITVKVCTAAVLDEWTQTMGGGGGGWFNFALARLIGPVKHGPRMVFLSVGFVIRAPG